MKNEEIKYLYGIYKRFKMKYPKLTFDRFSKEISRDDFDEKKFWKRLEYGDLGEFV